MILNSFIEENGKLLPIEVELELWPGLPDIHFIGCADQHLKESAKRIKSAIRSQGFEFKNSQQVLVNLRPSYLKKSSRGVELAVAAAYLAETGQIDLPISNETYFYGELSLSGNISEPQNLSRKYFEPSIQIVTGNCSSDLMVKSWQLSELKFFKSNQVTQKACSLNYRWHPPDEILNLQINPEWGRFLGIIALGNHSLLLAGSSGSGKTTAAKILNALLPKPTPQQTQELLKRYDELPAQERIWRPFIYPHHTIPLNSLIGGGNYAHGGELARSDLGTLLLDEFFEFSPHVMEALREPLESHTLRVTRGAIVRTYPLRTQVVATTNLCPCGEWMPGRGLKVSCRFTLSKCRSYAQKITGPLLDRFEVIKMVGYQAPSPQKILVQDLRALLEAKRAQTPPPLAPGVLDLLENDIVFKGVSNRRKAATLSLAQSIALWESQSLTKASHIEEALDFTYRSFDQVKRWDFF